MKTPRFLCFWEDVECVWVNFEFYSLENYNCNQSSVYKLTLECLNPCCAVRMAAHGLKNKDEQIPIENNCNFYVILFYCLFYNSSGLISHAKKIEKFLRKSHETNKLSHVLIRRYKKCVARYVISFYNCFNF